MPCLHTNITGDARRADFHRRCDIPPLYPVVGPCECIILGIIGFWDYRVVVWYSGTVAVVVMIAVTVMITVTIIITVIATVAATTVETRHALSTQQHYG
ncbi:MAG: hypothetical protein M0O96_11140 [Desulforhopalus sp.]|nr:hypothetical protein [Desulforhopalus sp.]